jgi:hypothetical protein
MKVISYSLYGSTPMYCVGTIRNAEQVREKYPGWKCLVWYDESVPKEVIEKLASFDHVLLQNMTNSGIPGMYWRFLCLNAQDIEIFCVRDSDSRITDREVDAVNDWIAKDKTLHIMRDHPHHNYPVMGGMWGFRNDRSRWDAVSRLRQWLKDQRPKFAKMDDMDFIGSIYSDYYNDCVVHDDWKRCPNSIEFPTKREPKSFVGAIHDEHDNPTDHWKFL